MTELDTFLKEFPNVTYAVRKKTERLMLYHAMKKTAQRQRNIFYVTSAVLTAYILLRSQVFLLLLTNFISSFFSTGDPMQPVSPTSLDLLAINLLLVFAMLSTAITPIFLRNRKKYNELRIHMLHLVHTGFCTCHRGLHGDIFVQKILDRNCDCKERFIKRMEGRGIDLIFEKPK